MSVEQPIRPCENLVGDPCPYWGDPYWLSIEGGLPACLVYLCRQHAPRALPGAAAAGGQEDGE